MQTVRIPFIEGLSQEIRRVARRKEESPARKAGIRCAFYMPITLKSVYGAKDRLPCESTTHARLVKVNMWVRRNGY